MAGKLNLFSLKKVLDNVQVPKSSNDAASNDTHQRLQRIQMLTSLTLDSDQTNPMGYEKVKIVGKGNYRLLHVTMIQINCNNFYFSNEVHLELRYCIEEKQTTNMWSSNKLICLI